MISLYCIHNYIVPEDFSIIFNQSSYFVTLNESSAISGNPLIHFTIYAQGSLIDLSITKSLVVIILESGGANSFTLHPSSFGEPLITTAVTPAPNVFVVSGMIWIAPNAQPQPGVYVLTLSASMLFLPVPVSEEATVNITLLETSEFVNY